jgi:pyruvate-formate lyase
MTIGGVTADGEDASNELTYLILEAANQLRTPHYTITLRVHEGTPEDLLVKALEVVKTGIGMPALALDKSFIDYMTSGGIPLGDARNYHLAGCVDPAIPGKASFLAGLFFVVPKVLEIFLNDEVDPRTGLEIRPSKLENLRDRGYFKRKDKVGLHITLHSYRYDSMDVYYMAQQKNLTNWSLIPTFRISTKRS